jgi:hypothetical protein
MKVTGIVEYQDLEGGIWQLAADDGKRYTLLGSRSALKSFVGQRVEVEGSLEAGFGIAMSGPQLQVEKLTKR